MKKIYNFYELKYEKITFVTNCYVVVSLYKTDVRTTIRSRLSLVELLVFATKTNVVCMLRKRGIYNHSGDDGKEDPPVPIPNTEVKLFYAESTYG